MLLSTDFRYFGGNGTAEYELVRKADRFRQLHAKFDQQARCYRASKPKPSAAMDQDVEPAP